MTNMPAFENNDNKQKGNINLMRKQQGLTLVELMVTIAIAGILLAIALFDTSQMSAQEKASNFSNEFKRVAKLARANAVTTGDPVVMCPVSTPGSDGGCLGDWNSGTIVAFADIDNNGSFSAATDVLLRALSPLTTNSQLTHSASATALSFNERGEVNAAQVGSFIYCPTSDNSFNVELSVTVAGTTRSLGKTAQTCS